MNIRTVKDLELDKIFSLIKQNTLLSDTIPLFNESIITDDVQVIEKRAAYIEKILSLLAVNDNGLCRFPSLIPLFEENRKSSQYLDGFFMNDLKDYLVSLKKLSVFLSDDTIYKDYFDALIQEIGMTISNEGHVLDTHPEVAPAISRLEEEKQRRYKFSQSFINNIRDSVQNTNPVFRNQRIAISVKAEAKALVKGYIQGASSSQNTFYIEPFELVELNNNVALYEDEIKRIKLKVLLRLSSKIKSHLSEIESINSFVIDFDFHYAFSQFVLSYKMERCAISDALSLIDIRHPLLGDRAVPISLVLKPEIKTVVLSGANAGGKTVTMKSIALVCILNQMMGFVPCNTGTVLPIFKSFYTDIGDGQSIEESESTFSSHMRNLANIVKKAGKDDLVILDELGTGTDPEEGSVLSLAILEYLKKKVKLTVVTSHFALVKRHAYTDKNVLNASMEFSADKGKPTYKIISGLPGDSHALEIAKNVGLDKMIINNAKNLLSDDSNSISQIIAELKGKARALDKKITKIELEKREVEKLKKDLEEKKRIFDQDNYLLKVETKDNLSVFLSEARKEFSHLLKTLKPGKGDVSDERKKIKNFISKLEDKRSELNDEIENDFQLIRQKPEKAYSVGDEVLCGKNKKRGILLENRGKGNWLVSLESLKMVLNESNFIPAPKESNALYEPFSISTIKPKFVLDVRGLTLEETKLAIDNQIESCIVHSFSNFSIIHGYGDGILSKGVHEYLKTFKVVSNYYFARPEDGGMGKTYVELFLGL